AIEMRLVCGIDLFPVIVVERVVDEPQSFAPAPAAHGHAHLGGRSQEIHSQFRHFINQSDRLFCASFGGVSVAPIHPPFPDLFTARRSTIVRSTAVNGANVRIISSSAFTIAPLISIALQPFYFFDVSFQSPTKFSLRRAALTVRWLPWHRPFPQVSVSRDVSVLVPRARPLPVNKAAFLWIDEHPDHEPVPTRAGVHKVQ